MKAIRNLVLLLILSITASGIPLYADSFDFDSLATPSAASVAIEASTIDNASDNIGVEVILTTTDKHIPVIFNERPLLLDIYSDDKLVKSINYDDAAQITPQLETFITPNTPVKFYLELNQEKLDLSNGSYTLMIKTVSDLLTLGTISVPLHFDTDFSYKPALQNIDRRESALLLYFPDNEYDYLIPITRVVPYTTTPLRKTVDELLKGPDRSLGIPTGTFIPTPQLGLNGRTANIYLPADIGVFQTQSTTSRIAYETFVNSLTSINEVDKVQFYFNRKIVEAGFHDLYVKDPVASPEGPRLYLGSLTENGRLLLTPDFVGSIGVTIDKLFDMLKVGGHNAYRFSRIAAVPQEVQLISHRMEDTTLVLTLNEAFATIYQDKPAHRDFMLEAMLYSFSSLDGVEVVQFELEGVTDYTGHNIPLGTPIIPSKYINPEK